MLICSPDQATNSNGINQHFINARRSCLIGHVYAVDSHDHTGCHPVVKRTDKTHKRDAVYIPCPKTEENKTVRLVSGYLPYGAFMRSAAINFLAKTQEDFGKGFCESGRMYYENRLIAADK